MGNILIQILACQGEPRASFWRFFYGLCIILALLHKAKILSTTVGRIFAMNNDCQVGHFWYNVS
jgi:hypothetical protein